MAAEASTVIVALRRWGACMLLAAVSACGGAPGEKLDSDPIAIEPAATTPSPTESAPAAAPEILDEAARILSQEAGVLRLQLDDFAYAPLAQQALTDGDADAWRSALPDRFARHDRHDDAPSSCGEDVRERITRFEDADARNVVELRACDARDAPTFLSGFSLQDDVVALRHGLSIGDRLDDILASVGVDAHAATADDVHTLEIVNAEDNTTLRLHLDASKRVRRIEYEPYAG